MKIKIWGCRGSIPSPGTEKNIYGGNTSCVQIVDDNVCIILDGGSGIQNLGASLSPTITEVNLLLTHLHIDHIIGLGFFQPLFNPSIKVNIWGPAASSESLKQRLRRYFSPPIFPVRLNELPCQLQLNEIHQSNFQIGEYKVFSDYLCHPGPTVGYRIAHQNAVLAYIPDHEVVLGSSNFAKTPQWTSGFSIAQNADLLLHDAQYTEMEYQQRIGWGHTSMNDAMRFAQLANAKKMMLFHHDPNRTDVQLQSLFSDVKSQLNPKFEVDIAAEGQTYII
jgi:phosphoribosyl 1,2-cyclic phosphodiesterase